MPRFPKAGLLLYAPVAAPPPTPDMKPVGNGCELADSLGLAKPNEEGVPELSDVGAVGAPEAAD